jgi:diguanylate cyclase (GGDEF)-like protein
VGDLVLVELASRLRTAVRESDTVVRLACDEFVVIFEGLAEPAEAESLGRKIVETMRKPVAAGEITIPLTVSLGIYSASSAAATAREFVDRADAALYRAKRNGRNRYEIDLG